MSILGFVVGTNGAGEAAQPLQGQHIPCSTGGEGDREQEPGEGEASIPVPLWGRRRCPFTVHTWSISARLRCWHTDGHLTALLWWRKMCLRCWEEGVVGFHRVWGQSMPLTMPFSFAPGDPQVNQSPNPSKCWCIFFAASFELGAGPLWLSLQLSATVRSIRDMGQQSPKSTQIGQGL